MKYTSNDIALPVFFASVNSEQIVSPPCKLFCKPISALHYHNLAELGICLSGSGETHIGNRIYSYTKGCIQVLPPYAPHLSCSYEGDQSSWIFISFDPQKILKNAGLLSPSDALELARGESFMCGVYEKDEFPELSNALDMIVEASKGNDSFTELSLSLAIVNFLIASARTKRNAGDESIVLAENISEKILPALSFIGDNLDDTERLADPHLAELCHISVATLRRLFIKHTGYSPKTYITRSRMAYAEYLLRKSDLSVLQISEYVGYGEISGFNRTFKAFFGISPLAYRKGN